MATFPNSQIAFASSRSNRTSSSTLSAATNLTPAFAGGKPKLVTLVKASTGIGSITFHGLVRAAMIPRILGIRCSAIPFWALTTTGSSTSFIS